MNLVTILQSAQSPDLATRQAAEAQLEQAVEQQYGPFVLALCAELAREENPESSRQLAGIYLKNLITAQDDAIQEVKSRKWLECDAATKEQIRQGFLQALQSKVRIASHTAAQVVAAFGAVDVPMGQWGSLLPALFNNVASADTHVVTKIASLEALGFLCDTMDADELEKSTVDVILNTIVDGMRSDRPNEIRRAAVTALSLSLQFTAKNFEVQPERDAIMQALCDATQCNDVNVRVKAFECLALVAGFYYDKLHFYMSVLFQLTAGAIKSDDQLVGQQAIEFWSTICDEEMELVDALKDDDHEGLVYLRIAEQAAPLLVPVILETLTKQDADGDDSWNIAMAGATCLQGLAQVLEDSIVDLVIPFISSSINSNEWRMKEASIMAFGCIMEGPSQEKLTPIVASAVPMLINCMSNENPLVRDTAVWTVGRLCEYHSSAISQEVLPVLVTALVASLEDRSSKVASQGCYAIHNLAAACSDDAESQTNVLSQFMPHILQKLLVVANREDWDSDNLRAGAYEAANSLVANSALDMRQTVIHVAHETLNRLEATLTVQMEAQERMTLQSLLCALLSACVQKLTSHDIKPLADRIMNAVLQVFNSKGAVAHEDAFMTVGYLADKLEGEFSRYIEYFQPALINGLKNIEEHAVCTVAIGVIGDLCRALGKALLPFCDDIVRHLLLLLQSPALNRSVKPHALAVFADIAMALGGDFERYSNIVLMILQQAGEVTITTDDEDIIEYINTLRESILESYTGILQGLKEDNKQDLVLPALDKMIEFIHRSAVDPHRTREVLKALIGLLGDLGHCFGSKMLQVLTQQYVTQLFQIGSNDEEIRPIANWAQAIVAKLRQHK